MRFIADLHVHSRFARATSRESTLENMAATAVSKGVDVLATGDFTHPGWFAEIEEKLVPAEPGLWKVRSGLGSARSNPGGASGGRGTRFVLQVEISTVCPWNARTRRVHHCVLVPDHDAAKRLTRNLARFGNLAADGRPTLRLEPRNLLEIVLDSDGGSVLFPAHIWTPWYSALGARSGFDSIEECYGDLSPCVFAVETGLSSDPVMNGSVSRLDRFSLVSNSDAHSPSRIGREATVFETDFNYAGMCQAMKTGAGLWGTVEFFPEEGKYFADGHAGCGYCCDPARSRELGGICPNCGQPLTVGVMHRLAMLADRPMGARPKGAKPFLSVVPLDEVLSELTGLGRSSKRVQALRGDLIRKIGPELFILSHAPIEDLKKLGSELLAEAVRRLRAGLVYREPGYDGRYGRIRLFTDSEIKLSRPARGAEREPFRQVP